MKVLFASLIIFTLTMLILIYSEEITTYKAQDILTAFSLTLTTISCTYVGKKISLLLTFNKINFFLIAGIIVAVISMLKQDDIQGTSFLYLGTFTMNTILLLIDSHFLKSERRVFYTTSKVIETEEEITITTKIKK